MAYNIQPAYTHLNILMFVCCGSTHGYFSNCHLLIAVIIRKPHSLPFSKSHLKAPATLNTVSTFDDKGPVEMAQNYFQHSLNYSNTC